MPATNTYAKNRNRPYKSQARWDTINAEYQRIFGRTTLPLDQQYWTMCADYREEYRHCIDSGIIQPNLQWRGVDIDKDVIKTNRKAYPNEQWLCNDFFWAMASSDPFRPGIVNYDSMVMANKAAPEVADILYLCSTVENECMVIVNIVTRHQHFEDRRKPMEDFVRLLVQESRYYEAFQKYPWKHDNVKYPYGKSTEMTTIIFYKR